jgi:eukaryotic-like serine/threonine-protein kinase
MRQRACEGNRSIGSATMLRLPKEEHGPHEETVFGVPPRQRPVGRAVQSSVGTGESGRGADDVNVATTNRLHDGIHDGQRPEETRGGDLTGTVVGERYALLGVIGEGGMGLVYEAEQLHTRRRFAVKVLSHEFCSQPTHVERFMREARATARIEHPNIVEIGDFGPTPNGSVFFAMEFLEGEDLGVMLHREGAQPWPRVRHIMLQLCAALDAAHRRGVVHRDVKPNNCFRTTRAGDVDFIKVLDFGIAKLLGEEHTTAKKLTRTGQIFGTPEYMSPEQVRGEAADPRMDIYSAGIILFELLTGHTPFESDAPLEILAKHLRDPIPSAAAGRGSLHMPRELETIVQRALAKNVSARFQTAEEFRDALERVGATERVEAAAVLSDRERAALLGKARRRGNARPYIHQLAGALGVLMLVAAVIIAAVALRRTRSRPASAAIDETADPKAEAREQFAEQPVPSAAVPPEPPVASPPTSPPLPEVVPSPDVSTAKPALPPSVLVAESSPSSAASPPTDLRLTREELRSVMRRADILGCGLRGRGWRPDETVKVEVDIAARTGRVKRSVAKHTRGQDKIASCVEAAVKSLSFPRGRAASTEHHTFRMPKP